MAKQRPFNTKIGGSTEGILGFVYVEFQFFRARDSSHQSLQSAKSGCVERSAMFQKARLGRFSPLSYYSLHLEQYP